MGKKSLGRDEHNPRPSAKPSTSSGMFSLHKSYCITALLTLRHFTLIVLVALYVHTVTVFFLIQTPSILPAPPVLFLVFFFKHSSLHADKRNHVTRLTEIEAEDSDSETLHSLHYDAIVASAVYAEAM